MPSEYYPEPQYTDSAKWMRPKPSSLGTLSMLPRELRDAIYKTVFTGSDGLIRISCLYWKDLPPRPANWYDTHFAILRTSRVIHLEAHAILTRCGTFSLTCHSLSSAYDRRWFVDYVSNVRFVIDANVICEHSIPSELMDGQHVEPLTLSTARPISFFYDTNISRNICFIVLYGSIEKISLLFGYLFFEALSRFTSFKRVELEIHLRSEIYPGTPIAHVINMPSKVAALLLTINNRLAPSLGPATRSQGQFQSIENVQIFTFRPREFSSQRERGRLGSSR